MKSLAINVRGNNFIISVLILILLLAAVKEVPAQGLGFLGKPADYDLTIKSFGSIINNLYSYGNTFPVAFDWRDHGVVTPAKDQGFCGSCWAFASVGALESKILLAGGPEYDLSEQQLMACNFFGWGCNGGYIALDFWYTEGPMEEMCTGYCACDFISCSNLDSCEKLPYRTTNYYTVDTSDINEIKASLYIDGPAFFGFTVYSDFRKEHSWQTTYSYWDDAGNGEVYTHSSGYKLDGHAVLLIGWDDTKGAWLCKNSWGTYEGPNGDGTFWIAYSDYIDLEFCVANMELSKDIFADFNGDGYTDLAIGVYGEDIGSIVDAGAVNVIYGSPGGLASTDNQVLSQATPGIVGTAEANDYFGYSLAAGDFNGDGYSDLAVGVYGEDIGSIVNAGAVNVIYGSPSGLTSTGDQLWYQSRIQGSDEANDYFGYSLVAGDFDGDGYTDLAIGVFGEDVGSNVNAGAVNVIYGSPSGLTSAGNQTWDQSSQGIADPAEANDYFGRVLCTGDFDSDGYTDLAVGVYGEDIGPIVNAGAVNVIYGSPSGLTSTGDQFWYQSRIQGSNEAYDNFGHSLVAGDFNGDGHSDLAIGVRGEDVGSNANTGAVNIIYGSPSGLTSTGNQFWHQASPGMQGSGEANDYFGSSLAAGDFDGDGYTDLAIGVFGEDVGSNVNAGAANVIYGLSSGLTSTGNQFWHQDSWGIQESGEARDYFGCTL